jgi:hypothetical protein
MHLAPQEWPCVLPAIQAVLNNSHSSHRAGQTPLTALTGHARDTPLSLTILHPIVNQSLSFIKAQQLAESTKLTQQVEQLHKEVTDKVSRQRRKQMEAHQANTHYYVHCGSVHIAYNDTCTRVLPMSSNRIHTCVVIYRCFICFLYNIAINTSHVIDCKESQTVHKHTCIEMSSRHYYIRIITYFNRRNLLKLTDTFQFKVYAISLNM